MFATLYPILLADYDDMELLLRSESSEGLI